MSLKQLDVDKIALAMDLSDPHERLTALGSEMVAGFLSTLKARLFDVTLKTLPRLDGYNRGTAGEKKKQRQNIISVVSTDKTIRGHDRYWRAYTDLWWSVVIDYLDAADIVSLRNLPDSDVAERFAACALRDNKNGRRVSREALREALAFSPYEISAATAKRTQALPSEADIDRDARFAHIPGRLDDLAAAFETLRRDAEKSRSDLNRSHELIVRRVDELGQVLVAVEASVLSLRQGLVERKGDISSSAAALEMNIAEAKEGLRSQRERLDALSARIEGAVSMGRDAFQSQLDDLRVLLDTVGEEVVDLRAHNRTDVHLADPEHTVTVALADRRSASGQGDRRAGASPIQDRIEYRVADATENANEVDQLRSWKEMYTAVSSLLLTLGTTRGTARRLSLKIVAALRIGQIPVLAGSISELVAAEIASCIGAPRVVQAMLKVGSFDTLSSQHIGAMGATALVLSGMARTAFEVAGGDVRKKVVQSQLGWGAPLGVPALATYESGAAALPINLHVLELGPFIELDSIHWRLRRNAGEPRRRHRLQDDLLDLRGDDLALDERFIHQLDQDVVAVGLQSSAAWRAGAVRYFAALTALDRETQDDASSGAVGASELAECFDCTWLAPLLASQEHDVDLRIGRWSKLRGDAPPNGEASLARTLLQVLCLRSW